jgi:carboxyl-terminal processing protease
LLAVKARTVLVLLVGTVLGLSVSFGGSVLSQRHAQAAARTTAEVPAEYVELLSHVLRRVRNEYVDDIDDDVLLANAIRGMLSELDPHSRYLDADEYEGIRISTTGNYFGVGLDVSLEDGKLTVVSPIDGAPAAEAGILPGDILIAVDEIPTDGLDVQAAVKRMRGKAGTLVTLDVVREGAEQPLRFALTRAAVQVQTVRGELLDGRYAYVRLSGFSDSTARELDRVVDRLKEEAGGLLRGLVLDLRNNPGGVLDAAVQVADRFVDGGVAVPTPGRRPESRLEHHARTGDSLEGVPVAVLVNAGTASASEIVAGALKDHGRGEIIGVQTYGKGSVQTVMPLAQGSAIKITTSRYVTPNGIEINGTGIEPNVVVRNRNPRQLYRGLGGTVALSEDSQLQEALRYVGYDAVAYSSL